MQPYINIPFLIEKINKCSSENEKIKLIWNWIKQEHINLKEFTEIIKNIKGE